MVFPRVYSVSVENRLEQKVQNLWQLFRRLPQGQLKQFCGKVDYITIRSTAKAVKPRVHFHAGITVCMEWTANHTAAVWTKAIGFCGLSGGNIQLYDFK